MRRARNVPLALVLALSVAGLAQIAGSAHSADTPTRMVDVLGAGAVTWPAFSADVDRYAVRPDTDGSVSLVVHASSSDPAGVVRVDGRRVLDGSATVDGVEAGDEISVLIDDAGGSAAYSFIVLPSQFPLLRRTTAPDPRVTDGAVLLTLGKWLSPGPFFETAVDENGVPAYVHQTPNSMDLRRQPNGNYSVARGGANGADIVELDEQFRELRRLRTTGLVHTDAHDSILNADGSAYLMAYESNAATRLVDAVIQHVAPDGEVLFEWNSADHVDVTAETVVGSDPDYAHVNSFEIMDDGDLLVSFRNLSSVFKIARRAHDGFAAGDVVWRLGGRASDFTFTDTEGRSDGGPCAQHTATQLDDGNIMVFDNGAWNLQPLCIDPTDPSGPPVARVPTRIAEWSLDETTMNAEMVKDFTVSDEQGDRYAIFAGSSQPLAGGNILVGWASARQAVASELSPMGDVLWEIVAPEDPSYFTYRAFKTHVPDAISPKVELAGTHPIVLDLGDTQVSGLTCSDRGGSNLRSCEVTGLDTANPHSGTMTVVATDGAGNRAAVQRAYTVREGVPTPTTPVPSATPATPTITPATPPPAARHRADLHVKVVGGEWRGVGAYDVRRGQSVRDVTAGARRVYRVRLVNAGSASDRFVVRLHTTGDARVPRWVSTRRTVRLSPGKSVTLDLVLRRGDARRDTTRIVARSVSDRTARDRVWVRSRWR